MSLNIQFQLMIHMFVYGLFVGITYDCFRMLKEGFKSEIVGLCILLIYWAIQFPLAFIYIYKVNEGIFHLYILIFLFLGAWCYFKYLRQNLRQDLENLGISLFAIANFIKKFINIVVISPLLFIYKLVSDIMLLILRFLKLVFYNPSTKLYKKVKVGVLNKRKVRRRGKKTNSSIE
ncbi:MAG TPA: spore cortex biosynthesis protein YabQ [Firmicutes bacterium]|nr:spore cortex biosynthesis protein YabQ [Bacillota bacterium]